MSHPKMPIYYVFHHDFIIPCYLIKEGYIPVKDYREDRFNDYYGAYTRDNFCIRFSGDKKDIYENLGEAKKVMEKYIQDKYVQEINDAHKNRDIALKDLEKVK